MEEQIKDLFNVQIFLPISTIVHCSVQLNIMALDSIYFTGKIESLYNSLLSFGTLFGTLLHKIGVFYIGKLLQVIKPQKFTKYSKGTKPLHKRKVSVVGKLESGYEV